MRKLLIIAVVLFGMAATPSFGWKFASISGSRGGGSGVNTAELLAIVNAINQENVDLVIFAGDAVDGCT